MCLQVIRVTGSLPEMTQALFHTESHRTPRVDHSDDFNAVSFSFVSGEYRNDKHCT